MNILFVTNTVKKYALVYKNVLDIFVECGHKIVWAGNFSSFAEGNDKVPCIMENIPIQSNPFKKSNKIALSMIKNLIQQYNIDCIYCSTPIGSTLARIAIRRFPKVKLIYAAHGFLFFKHSKKWYLNPIFKLHEKVLAKYTDCLITITNEDYLYAKNHLKLRNGGNIYLINGAGIELSNKPSVDIKLKRESLGLTDEDYVIISAGFLNKNKNNIVILKALHELKNKAIKYLVCGEGDELSNLKKAVKQYNLEDNVFFLGYRQDMDELYCVSNLFVMPSFREGMPRSLLEAMNYGMPCIGSNIRGISDLIGNYFDARFLCNPNNSHDFARAIDYTMRLDSLDEIRQRNIMEAKKYSKEVVIEQLKDIFSAELLN